MKNKKVLIIIIAVVVLVIVGIVATLFLMGGEPKEKELVFANFSLDEQYSNLLIPEGTAKAIIAKYRVHIKHAGEETTKMLEDNKVMLQNNVDEIFRSTKPEDISKTNGKEKLRGRIKNMIIDRLELDESLISDVFLDPFVVQ